MANRCIYHPYKCQGSILANPCHQLYKLLADYRAPVPPLARHSEVSNKKPEPFDKYGLALKDPTTMLVFPFSSNSDGKDETEWDGIRQAIKL